jgi:glycosyltransferase involved in cell wall biosynthesis
MDALVLAALAFALFGTLTSLCFAVFYLRQLGNPTEAPQARVTVILPATGPLRGLEDLIADLARQSLPPRRLIVAVESKADPAYERVRSAQAATVRPTIDLVVAGQTVTSGQKNANILAALKELGPEDDYILLIDADIRPQPCYVASLVEALVAGRHDLVNGYRWLTPMRSGVFAALIAALDRRIGMLPGPQTTMLIWGGSIALTKRALAALDLPATLAGRILDDLPIGARASSVGLSVWARRSARAPTPLDSDPRRLFAFGRRQLQFLRLHRPGLWRSATLIAIADLFARLVLLAKAAIEAPHFSAALAALIALAALDWLSTELRFDASRRLGVVDTRSFRMLNRVFAWTILPLPLVGSALLCASFAASHIAWAHVRYTVDKTGRVLRVERDSEARQGETDAVADCLYPAESS